MNILKVKNKNKNKNKNFIILNIMQYFKIINNKYKYIFNLLIYS